jgi:hypothetical protein
MNSPQIRIEPATYKKLKFLKVALEHDAVSKTIQFLLDEYQQSEEKKGNEPIQ